MGGDALPVVGQGLGAVALQQAAEQGAHQAGVLFGFELALGFEGVAELHQLFDPGEDEV